MFSPSSSDISCLDLSLGSLTRVDCSFIDATSRPCMYLNYNPYYLILIKMRMPVSLLACEHLDGSICFIHLCL